jgi:hypothetical protein
MSKRKACVHPYASLQAFHDEPSCCYDCDGGPTHYFTCCNACNAILDGEIPNPIPRYWENAARVKAQTLTGYEVEPAPPPRVGPPSLVETMLMNMFDSYALEAFNSLTEVTEAAFGTKDAKLKTATATFPEWRK